MKDTHSELPWFTIKSKQGADPDDNGIAVVGDHESDSRFEIYTKGKLGDWGMDAELMCEAVNQHKDLLDLANTRKNELYKVSTIKNNAVADSLKLQGIIEELMDSLCKAERTITAFMIEDGGSPDNDDEIIEMRERIERVEKLGGK